MAVYRPKYRDPKSGKLVSSNVFWVEFTLAGQRIRESSKSTRKTIAKEYEKRRRLELEQAYAGMPAEDPCSRIRSVREILATYQTAYEVNHRPHSIASTRSALKNVEKHLGEALLPDLTEDRVRHYVAARKKEGVCGRTINVEVGELSRAIGKPWRMLWPRLRSMEERHDVGRALNSDEKQRLLQAADISLSPALKTLVRAALLTGTRGGELTSLRWRQVDFDQRTITIGKAKTVAGTGRVIPMNDELVTVMAAHDRWFTEAFGETRAEYCSVPSDPTRPTVEIKTAWNTLRTSAKVNCRWHDLRHTACSDMNEAGVPEAMQLAIFGWSSRKMIERYSHIRTEARRSAMDSLTLKAPQKPEEQPNPIQSPKDSPKVDTPTLVM
ncbi:MAG: site-specific integrase [Candidatus Solibacter sp.]|nr:site-specific integrase [Candidatus Solibacter sp.]